MTSTLDLERRIDRLETTIIDVINAITLMNDALKLLVETPKFDNTDTVD